ncbi:MAG: 2-oxoacid:acceptor oxidoreductase family protein [Lentisphaeria bacterium]|nr:2-oxoacid:acceptor oxidoreductase family protein [Lentisphaeria bacterium]
MNVTNVIFAGLGGQGVLKGTDILGEVLFEKGFDVKKSEVHGMSQRGGSVSSEVRYGEKVFSPMIPHGEADYLIVLDETQVEVNISKLKKDGILISPKDVPTDKLANPKALNIMLLGALSVYLQEIELDAFLNALKMFLPEKLYAMNEEAFLLGRNSVNK